MRHRETITCLQNCSGRIKQDMNVHFGLRQQVWSKAVIADVFKYPSLRQDRRLTAAWFGSVVFLAGPRSSADCTPQMSFCLGGNDGGLAWHLLFSCLVNVGSRHTGFVCAGVWQHSLLAQTTHLSWTISQIAGMVIWTDNCIMDCFMALSGVGNMVRVCVP